MQVKQLYNKSISHHLGKLSQVTATACSGIAGGTRPNPVTRRWTKRSAVPRLNPPPVSPHSPADPLVNFVLGSQRVLCFDSSVYLVCVKGVVGVEED